MELNREQEQITNANNDLYEYVKRIVAAVKYKGGCDHEDVPSILREFAKGYEQKIKELTEEKEKLGIENFDLICELSRIKEETVRKMQERLKERYKLPQSNEVSSVSPFQLHEDIDQTAKELLEEGSDDA